MRELKVRKAVINIGVGEAGEKLIKAQKVLELLTNHKSIQTLSKKTNKDLGIREGMPIGCKVTLRDIDAVEFLKRALWVKNNKLAEYNFDYEGNFSFGIPDYTDFQEMKYDPDIGIFGMDISVTVDRPGTRVARKRRNRGRIPRSHRVGRAESMEFITKEFDVEIIE
ncbi:MAG: 50S ribosomal protein L5 [Methanobacteriota archaeon]|nr:MAG: 50S ribosomal protein L5 [Euryarchaeota archaeon]